MITWRVETDTYSTGEIQGYNIISSDGREIIGCEGLLADKEVEAKQIAMLPDLIRLAEFLAASGNAEAKRIIAEF